MLAGMTALLASACTAPAPEADFDSALPAARLHAIERAGASGDETAAPRLVEQLDSDDAAVRMLASEALKGIEGDTCGYWFADPPRERQEAIERWIDHLSPGRSPAEPAADRAPCDDG
jgi:HEAT repeat protein